MAAPVVASKATGTNGSNAGTAYTVALPTGTVNGDLLIAVNVSEWGTLANNSVPTGFTLLSTSSYDGGSNKVHVAIGRRVASSEPASYTFPSSNSSSNVGALLRITGADPTTPVIAQVAAVGSNSAPSTTAPSITPNGASDLLLTFYGAEVNGASFSLTWTPPAGMTEQVDAEGDQWVTLAVDSLASPSSPSGTKTASSSPATAFGGACTISIAPAAGGGGGTNYPISGTVAAVSGTSGSITARHPLSGVVAASSATTGSITAQHPLAGTVAATSGTAGTVAANHPLSGTATVTSASTGTITADHPLGGTVAAASTTSGAITTAGATTWPFAGTVVATSGTSGAVTVNHSLGGTVATVSGTAGTITADHQLAGVAAATSTTAGTITYTGILAGTTAATSGASGDLIVAGAGDGKAVTKPTLTLTTPAHSMSLGTNGGTVALTTTTGTLGLTETP